MRKQGLCVGGCGYRGKCACGTGFEKPKPKKKVKHRCRFDRCWNLVDKAEEVHVPYCRCGKRKPYWA